MKTELKFTQSLKWFWFDFMRIKRARNYAKKFAYYKAATLLCMAAFSCSFSEINPPAELVE